MINQQPNKHNDDNDYNLNLKIIMLLVAAEVLILVSISFVRIYVDKKQSIIRRMSEEVQILEKVFVDDIDYSLYILTQISDLIKVNHNSLPTINNILSNYSTNSVKHFFGWHEFYWLDKDLKIASSNNDGLIPLGTKLDHISHIRLSKIVPDKPFYGLNPNFSGQITKPLDIILGVSNPDTGEYLGSLFLEMETSSILEDLETYRRNDFTNFVVVDSRHNIITAYPVKISRLGINSNIINNNKLLDDLKKIDCFNDQSKEVTYLDMISGLNYYIKKIKNKPFVLIVSIDPSFVKHTITQKIAIKFLEIIILASFFLVLVISIYKRETWLRARAEKASQLSIKAMNSKSDFLSYTAHEIRSPLGFILTGSEIMNKKLLGPVPAHYVEYVEGINKNANLILDFIKDILEERHIVMGNIKIVDEICDINEIITQAIVTNRTRFNDRKISIRRIGEVDLPKLFGDRRKILQILNNLISNSYKYSLDDTEITIKTRMMGQKLQISVSDQGIGMSKEDIEIALKKFGTVHLGKSNNWIDSYGLGLPIVKMLLKAHGAELEINSKINIGTIITITFPSKRIISAADEEIKL